MNGAWPPNQFIKNRPGISTEFLNIGITSLFEAFHFVWKLPYGRISVRETLKLVIMERRGTCSSKHAMLAQLCREQWIKVDLCLGLFRMSEKNTPKVGRVLSKYRLDFIPEAHCYLRFKNEVIDLTEKPSSMLWMDDLLCEEVIYPEQAGVFKVQRHREFLRDWLAGPCGFTDLNVDQLWAIREECILNLQ